MSDYNEDNRGYVCLHRKLLDDPIFKNPKTLQLFTYCLLKCTHKDYTASIGDQFVELNPGQFVSGRIAIARDLKMSEQTARTTLNNLKKLGFLTIKSTNKFSVFTVLKWNTYQQPNNRATNEQPQTNTLNTIIKKKATSRFVKPEIIDITNYFLTKELNPTDALAEAIKFFDFYESKNWFVGKNKMSKWKNAASGWISRGKKNENTTGNGSKENSGKSNDTDWINRI